jgi:putative ABC transport system ATP-binding protein
MTLGQLVAAELIVTVILGSFAKIGKDLESYYDLMASVDKLGKLFDLPIEPSDTLRLPRTLAPRALSLMNLKLDAGCTSSCNLEFAAGQSTAIHGSSELRRSKLIEIMVGHAKAQSGYVLIDDYRIDTISAESLQESVSLIREVEVFEGNVDENIRMGREGLGSDRVNQIIDQLGLDGTVSGLSDGLVTRLSISGYPLSQGEAIRLVLARTFIASPGVVFIDGLLDRLSDSATIDVLNRLKSFSGETTIIISTGRQAIAEWADQNLDISVPSWELAKYTG